MVVLGTAEGDMWSDSPAGSETATHIRATINIATSSAPTPIGTHAHHGSPTLTRRGNPRLVRDPLSHPTLKGFDMRVVRALVGATSVPT